MTKVREKKKKKLTQTWRSERWNRNHSREWVAVGSKSKRSFGGHVEGAWHRRAVLIFCTVHEIKLFTVSTDSTVSLSVGKLFTSIWNATVNRLPPPPSSAAGTTANPDGSKATYAESPPFITACMAGMSTGAYTTSDPDASVQVSCRISMLLWFGFRDC